MTCLSAKTPGGETIEYPQWLAGELLRVGRDVVSFGTFSFAETACKPLRLRSSFSSLSEKRHKISTTIVTLSVRKTVFMVSR
jgi:hypothetical protein